MKEPTLLLAPALTRSSSPSVSSWAIGRFCVSLIMLHSPLLFPRDHSLRTRMQSHEMQPSVGDLCHVAAVSDLDHEHQREGVARRWARPARMCVPENPVMPITNSSPVVSYHGSGAHCMFRRI